MTNTKNTTKTTKRTLNAIARHLDEVQTSGGTYWFARMLGLAVSNGASKESHIGAIIEELSTDPTYCDKLMVLVNNRETFVVSPDGTVKMRRNDADMA